jgi:hypothetical protein
MTYRFPRSGLFLCEVHSHVSASSYLITLLILFCFHKISHADCGFPTLPSSTEYKLSDQALRGFLESTNQQVLPSPLKNTNVSDGFALLVGVADTNVRLPEFPKLRYPEKEVKLMRKYLRASGYRVKTLLNSEATRHNILQWLIALSRIGGKNRFIFYYTGHGAIYGKIPVKYKKEYVQGIFPYLDQDARSKIEQCLTKAIYEPLGLEPFPPESIPSQVWERINRSFFLLPYQQPSRKDDTGPFDEFQELVGYDEIAAILASNSENPEKIVMIDACSAGFPKPPIFNPLPKYSPRIQRQGFVFLSLITPDEQMKIYENVFTPVMASAIMGGADTSGDGDGIVTAFELVSYANRLWRKLQTSWGIQPNQMNHMIFGSDDIPITVSSKGRHP